MLDLRRIAQRFIRRGAAKAASMPKRPPGAAEPLPRLPLTYQDAAQSLSRPDVITSARYKARIDPYRPGNASNANLHPEILRFKDRLLKELRERGIPFFMHSGFRTAAEQEALYARRVTKARAWQSPHNHGMAVDLVCHLRGWDLTALQWAVIGHIGKEVARKLNLKVTWGGDWKFYDPAHWELADWSSRVRNGE